MKILVTCPPMLGMMDELKGLFDEKGVEVHCPEVVQTLSVGELMELVPGFDGWIIGDDPATEDVFRAGKEGRLKAAVKWGIGVDNVDFKAAEKFDIPVINTPDMFGREVADLAISYMTALARDTFIIDREIRNGGWPKPRGMSLSGKTLALIGFGDIGRNTAKRALAAEMKVIAYDPFFKPVPGLSDVEHATWPQRIDEADFMVFTCSLNKENYHMLHSGVLQKAKRGVRIVNVARGPLIDEPALVNALMSGDVHSAALDVFETEPLPMDSPLRKLKCIFGSHNGSNTSDAVRRASERAVSLLFEMLGIR